VAHEKAQETPGLESSQSAAIAAGPGEKEKEKIESQATPVRRVALTKEHPLSHEGRVAAPVGAAIVTS
jgi:hypothetical protein